MFDIPPDSCLCTSAKTGFGLADVLPAVIARIPPPTCAPLARPLRRWAAARRASACPSCGRLSTPSPLLRACGSPLRDMMS